MKKKRNKTKVFRMNTTIKQKRRAFIQSSAVLCIMASIITFFVANIISNFFEKYDSFSKFELWLTRFPLSETIFGPAQSSSFLFAFLTLVVIAFMAVRGYTRITDDITTEGGTAQWGTVKAFNEKYSLSSNPDKPDDYKDMIISEHVRISTEIYHHQTALNTVVLGATRSGKSRYFIKPNLLQMNVRIVC